MRSSSRSSWFSSGLNLRCASRPRRFPFVTTVATSAGEGAIPVFGAGTVRPRAEIDVSAAESTARSRGSRPRSRVAGASGAATFSSASTTPTTATVCARRARTSRRVRSALLQAEEDARIARQEYELFLRRQSDAARTGDANPLTLREPQLEAARAALARDSAALAGRRTRPGAHRGAGAVQRGRKGPNRSTWGQFVAGGSERRKAVRRRPPSRWSCRCPTRMPRWSRTCGDWPPATVTAPCGWS